MEPYTHAHEADDTLQSTHRRNLREDRRTFDAKTFAKTFQPLPAWHDVLMKQKGRKAKKAKVDEEVKEVADDDVGDGDDLTCESEDSDASSDGDSVFGASYEEDASLYDDSGSAYAPGGGRY